MKRFTITIVESVQKTYTIIARDLENALDRLDSEDVDSVKQLDWHIAETKVESVCECGCLLPEDQLYCESCIEEMNDREEAEEAFRRKREDAYDASRGH
jgi:hypothetical protein